MKHRGACAGLILSIVTYATATAAAGQVAHNRAEKFVVVSDPPGAIIELRTPYATDTLGPAPMAVEHVRGGTPSQPFGFKLRALPVGSSVCLQVYSAAPERPAPDTIHFDMSRCREDPTDWTAVFDTTDVDEVPERLNTPALEYPFSLRDAGIEGAVRLRFVIGGNGRVEPNSMVVDSASHPGFVPPATAAVLRSVFRPGMLAGRAVRVQVGMPLTFNLRLPFQGPGGASLRDPRIVRPSTKRRWL